MKTTQPQVNQPDDILTVEQVADLLQLHPNTIYEKANAGEIPGMFRLGDGERAPMRFSRRLLMEWIANQATKVTDGR